MHSVGVDIIEIERVRGAITRFGDKFLKRIFTGPELAYCRGRPEALAARFAGKEAVMKTLGEKYISWQNIEILPDEKGRPTVSLYGKAREYSTALGLSEIAISLSHSREYAVAAAVAEIQK